MQTSAIQTMMLTGRAVEKMKNQTIMNLKMMNNRQSKQKVVEHKIRRNTMSGKSMDSKAASRIQSSADKSGTNQGFKARAMSAASKNKK
jgi:predicted metallo-beta-lactamase superfamily hydrolase